MAGKKIMKGKFDIRIVSHLMEKPKTRLYETVHGKMEWRYVKEKYSSISMRGGYFRYKITPYHNDWRMKVEGSLAFSLGVFPALDNMNVESMRLFCSKVQESNVLLQDRMLVPAFVFDWNMEREIIKDKISKIMESDPQFMDEWMEDFWTGRGYYSDMQKVRELERLRNRILDRIKRYDMENSVQDD